jgi:RNA polymerase sigma-70 factor (ECF subfamily)
MSSSAIEYHSLRQTDHFVDDLSAYDSLFGHFYPRLVRFLSKRLDGTHVDPEDVAQEAMLKAWRNREQFDPRFQFSTWVYTIATRTATDHLRRPVRDQCSERLDEISGRTSQPEQRMEEAEFKQSIWAIAEQTLTKRQHAAMWLRCQEQMSIKEVSKALSMSSVSVRVLLHRARAVLKLSLVEHVNENTHFQVPSSGD